MALFTNRVFDPTASAFVRWNTASPDTGGGSYPGPDAFGNTSDFVVESVTDTGGVTDHGNLLGLADDDHLQYALLLGRAGGQSLLGGTGVSDTLTLRATSNGSPGDHNVVINDNLDLSTFNLFGVGGFTSAGSGINAGQWTFNNGVIANKSNVGPAVEAKASQGDAVAVISLESDTGVSGSNAAASGIHVGDQDPNSNVDADEGVLYVQVGVGTSTVYVKNTASGTLTGWTDLNAAATPAGSSTEIQFNTAGAFDASPSLTWSGTTLNVLGSVRSNVQFNVIGTGTSAVLSGTTSGGENPAIQLNTSAGTNGGNTNIHVGVRNPNSTVTGIVGAMYMRADPVTPNNSSLFINVDGAQSWSNLRLAGGGGDFINDFITGETVGAADTALSTSLSQVPSDPESILIVYNRQTMSQGQDFTVSGNTVTWLAGSGTAPQLVPSDTLFVYYVIDSVVGSIDFKNDFITTQTITGTDTALSVALSFTPSDPESVLCSYNRQIMSQGQDFTVSGTTVTWLASSGTAPNLVPSDTLQFYYVTNTSGGAGDFLGLTDTPVNYAGEALKVVRVNAGETGLEFSTVAAGDTFTFTSLKASNYTASAFEIVKVLASSGPFTIELPASPSVDDLVKYVNTTSSMTEITVDGGTNNINGSLTRAMTGANENATFGFDGIEWFLV